MNFFEKAKTHWVAEKVVQKTYQVCNSRSSPDELNISGLQPMFTNDPGDMGIRSMVFGWKLLKAD